MNPSPAERWQESKPYLLIAHPNKAIRERLAADLAEYRIDQVAGGAEALEYAQRQEPDLIIAHFEMAEYDGFRLTETIRTHPALNEVPVALITPDSDELLERAVLAGAADVFQLPTTPAGLQLRVRNLLRTRATQRELERKNSVIVEALNDLRESETMLVQADKLTVLGEMMAGIVHEINNPINYAKSALFVLKRMVADMEEGEDQEDFADLVGDVTDGLERVGQIVFDLRAFATKGEMEIEEVDLRNVVQTAARLISNKIKTITYVEEVEEELYIKGHENNLVQVVLNLIKNGVEATEEAGRSLDQTEIQVKAERQDGTIVLRVRDNGCGIDEKDRASVFEPFFSTKGRGAGMGLGLSICKRVLNEQNVTIEVDSVLGQWTEFILTFSDVVEDDDELGSCTLPAAHATIAT